MRMILATLVTLCLAGSAAGAEWSHRLLAAPKALPPLPDTGLFPVQLVLDDNGAEGAIGVGGATARQFLWFQRFSPAGVNLELAEIWVLFPSDPEIAPGAAIQLVVYQDGNGDPTDGATLLAVFDEVVQVADDATFTVYPAACTGQRPRRRRRPARGDPALRDLGSHPLDAAGRSRPGRHPGTVVDRAVERRPPGSA